MASEAREEIARVRALRAAAVKAAGLTSLPESILWDVPDEGFGYKLSKLQQLVFDDIKAYRLLGLIRRAKALLPNDQRRTRRTGILRQPLLSEQGAVFCFPLAL